MARGESLHYQTCSGVQFCLNRHTLTQTKGKYQVSQQEISDYQNPPEIDIPTPSKKKQTIFDWFRTMYLTKQKLFWIVIAGGLVVLCCPVLLIASLFGGDSTQTETAHSIEDAVAQLNATITMQAALVEAQATLLAVEPTETPIPEIVYLNCPECVDPDGTILPITLWQSPDDMGVNSPKVDHGDQCQLLDQQTSAEGIDKSLIECSYGRGWTRTNSLVSDQSLIVLPVISATEVQTIEIPEPQITPSAVIVVLLPTSTPQAIGNADIRITHIYYDGQEGRKEPDEYVEIINTGNAAINLAGWALSDESGKRFTFPEFVINAGQSCRIYTDQHHPESCGFNWSFTQSAIWNNDGDCATLQNGNGDIVDSYCY